MEHGVRTMEASHVDRAGRRISGDLVRGTRLPANQASDLMTGRTKI